MFWKGETVRPLAISHLGFNALDFSFQVLQFLLNVKRLHSIINQLKWSLQIINPGEKNKILKITVKTKELRLLRKDIYFTLPYLS